MPDLENILTQDSDTVKAICNVYKKQGDSEPNRPYLGASIIGYKCERYLWYVFRMCCAEEFDGRMYRLFETGDREEERVANNLREIGCEVHTIDPNTGEQFEISDFNGHFIGHLDGVIKGIPEAKETWHVLECKTHNEKSFNKLKVEGVKKSKPMHYAQMQVYMHYTGLKRALYFAVNKNTDELYAERIDYNKEEALALVEKAKRIIFSPVPLQRISDRPDYYECKWCAAHDICHGNPERALPLPVINCRQCCHATPCEDGTWKCEKWNTEIPKDVDNPSCEQHLPLPALFPYAEVIDGGNKDYDWIHMKFKNDKTKEFHVSPYRPDPSGCLFSTKELMLLSQSDLTNTMVVEAKKQQCVVTGKNEETLFD